MRRLINAALWLVGLTVVLVVYFLVPLGRFTLFEHTLRIASTAPAQELGDELDEATRELGARATDEWEARAEIRRSTTEGETEDEAPDDPSTMRLRLEDDGVHLGEDTLSHSQLRTRIREARQTASDVRAILETADGVTAPRLNEVLRLLREEHVAVVPPAR